MTREAWLEYCRSLEGAQTDCPFRLDERTTVARHTRSRKWFGILMEKEGASFINLKCEPVEAAFLRGGFEGIQPAWHMNKDHWITVLLDSDVPDALIRSLTLGSYRLTAPVMRGPARREPGAG